MIKKKDNKIFIFAEIGKSNLSSKASEDLLNDLAIRLNQNYKKNIVNIYYYPIYSIKNKLNWIISFNKESNNKQTKYLLSTSIKLLRDLLYILTSIITINNLKPKISFFYNLNKLQISILSFIKIFIKIKINIIQADGYLLDNNYINLFDNIIVFSNYTYNIYKRNIGTKIYFAYPFINKKNNQKFISKIRNKDFNLLHAGSISKYNVCEESINKLYKFCELYPNCKVYFTTSQKNIPEYFKLLLQRKPNNFIYKGFMNKSEFDIFIKKIHFGIDLRNFLNLESDNNKCDFPSKILFYIRNNLFVLSTKSISIPENLRSWLIPIEDINYISDIDYNEKEILINNLTDNINAQSIDSIIIKKFNCE